MLLNKLGYYKSPFKETYKKKLFRYGYSNSKYLSKVIAKLNEEIGLRYNVKRKQTYSEHIAISYLSAFAFCPASYAIKETYNILQFPGVEEGLEEHRNSNTIEQLIEHIKTTQREFDSHQLSPLENIFYSDVLNSDIVVKGRDQRQQPFFSPKRELVGLPDYVFRRQDGSQFHVDERHTWNSRIEVPWYDHTVQAYGYLYGLKQLNLTNSYILYFKWDHENHRRDFGRPTIFIIERSDLAYTELVQIYRSVKNLRCGQTLEFRTDIINTNKCFACSVRYYCNHKNGLLNTLRFPYGE